MAVYTMANAKIYIGTTADADDISSFSADTYQEIGEVESISALNDTQNFTPFTALSDGRARQLKTTRSGDNITITCGFDPDDAGQDALRTAALLNTQAQYNFKVVYNDAGSTNATTVYWRGKAGNESFPGGSNSDVEMVEYVVTNDTGFTVEFRS
jgi:hypothetical protein